MDSLQQAEADRVALMRADREPPFTSRNALVRMMATSYPAHTLAPAIRRAAARDVRLEWRVGEGRYGYRLLAPAATLRDGRAEASQHLDSLGAPAAAPAPALGALDSVAEGAGGQKVNTDPTAPTGGSPERERKQPFWRAL